MISKFCIDSIERCRFFLSWKCCNWLHSSAPSSFSGSVFHSRSSKYSAKEVFVHWECSNTGFGFSLAATWIRKHEPKKKKEAKQHFNFENRKLIWTLFEHRQNVHTHIISFQPNKNYDNNNNNNKLNGQRKGKMRRTREFQEFSEWAVLCGPLAEQAISSTIKCDKSVNFSAKWPFHYFQFIQHLPSWTATFARYFVDDKNRYRLISSNLILFFCSFKIKSFILKKHTNTHTKYAN